MENRTTIRRSRVWQWGLSALTGLLIVGIATRDVAANAPSRPSTAPTVVSLFEDVPDDGPFTAYINNIYTAGIVGGYTCGGPNEPCIAPGNRPYYRPTANVSRQQMGKFLDLGRRNIADAIGTSLHITSTVNNGIVISTTTGADGLLVNNASGGYALLANCTKANNNCYAVSGFAPTGDFAAVFSGGRGVSSNSQDATYPGVAASSSGATASALRGSASGASSYGGEFTSSQYRAGYAKSSSNGLYSMYVDTQDGPSQGTAGLEVNGSVRMEGNLYVAGSKAGYVVDIMQNAGDSPLEAGDVVTIVGNGPPVLGQIPVVRVKKASSAYDTGVVGVVDQVVYVPDATTQAAYTAQEQARRTALSQIQQAEAAAKQDPTQKAAINNIVVPEARISDAQGTMHAVSDATQVAAEGYTNVVTLGSYKAVKVDASFGAIKAGDLLTSSPHAGYAMKVTDKAAAGGAVIGKALGDLNSGTGLIPVMVTLK